MSTSTTVFHHMVYIYSSMVYVLVYKKEEGNSRGILLLHETWGENLSTKMERIQGNFFRGSYIMYGLSYDLQ